MRVIDARPLSAQAFAPFGEVIELHGAERIAVNQGSATRFHDLATIDATEAGGRPSLSVFRAEPRAEPVQLRLMERHPLGSQAFVPLGTAPYLVVVAPDIGGRPGELFAFLARAGQGVNYARGTWHHPLLALRERSDFLVIDRVGEGLNLEERALDAPVEVAMPAP